MQHYRILIVEDEADVQMLLCLFLERLGHTLYRARDGVEAIAAAEEHSPDMILMDIQMPRKTGIDAVRELRAQPQFATTPILAITAHARSFLPSDIVRAGFDHVVFKPFEFTEIIDWIESVGQRV